MGEQRIGSRRESEGMCTVSKENKSSDPNIWTMIRWVLKFAKFDNLSLKKTKILTILPQEY
jgi:hypothetical protein